MNRLTFFSDDSDFDFLIFSFNTPSPTAIYTLSLHDALPILRQETVRALHSMGIPIEYVHHEVGPSQHEIDMRFAPALTMADHTVTYRLIVKEIAKKARSEERRVGKECRSRWRG